MVVIGAGLAGLSSAIALAHFGHKVIVLEQASEAAEIGAGIQVTPNGMAVLEALGVSARLLQAGVAARRIEVCDYRKGKRLFRINLERGNRRNSSPYLLIHRADLIKELERLARSRGVKISFNSKVAGREIRDDKAVLRLDRGGAIAADLIVGADGHNSIVRAHLNYPDLPSPPSHFAWRSVVSASDLDSEFSPGKIWLTLAPNRHLVCYPIRAGNLINCVAVAKNFSPLLGIAQDGPDSKLFTRLFQDFNGPIRNIIECCQPAEPWPLSFRDVAATWFNSRMVILGDALHPVLPFLGQGANLAFEDAWVLASELSKGGPIPDALKRFKSVRIDRVRRVSRQSAKHSRIYHMAFPPARFALHAGFRMFDALPGLLERRFDWLHMHDVTKSETNRFPE